MTKSVLRFVTLGTFITILGAALPFTPAFGGPSGYPASLMRLDPPEPSSPPPRPAHIKSTHKVKKIARHSSIRQRGT
jgi:hypothetical protein